MSEQAGQARGTGLENWQGEQENGRGSGYTPTPFSDTNLSGTFITISVTFGAAFNIPFSFGFYRQTDVIP
nr:hypothetical protein SUGSMm_36970 [Morganella morganii subsp. sibonii]